MENFTEAFTYGTVSKDNCIHPGMQAYMAASKERFRSAVLQKLPEKWAVLDEGKDVVDWFNKVTGNNYIIGQGRGYMHYPPHGTVGNTPACFSTDIRPGYTQITPEQFKKYVMNKEEKKIIGYLAPFDMFSGKIQKGTQYRPLASQKNTTYAAVDNEGAPRDGGVTNLPKEIVETWEPVYEQVFPEVHVGDYVRIVGERKDWLKDTPTSVFKVVLEKTPYLKGFFYTIENPVTEERGGLVCGYEKIDLEAAIEAMAPDITVDAMDGERKVPYKAVFDKDTVVFGCARFHKEFILDMDHLINGKYQDTNRSVTHIQVGRGIFTPKAIHLMANYYNFIYQ